MEDEQTLHSEVVQAHIHNSLNRLLHSSLVGTRFGGYRRVGQFAAGSSGLSDAYITRFVI